MGLGLRKFDGRPIQAIMVMETYALFRLIFELQVLFVFRGRSYAVFLMSLHMASTLFPAMLYYLDCFHKMLTIFFANFETFKRVESIDSNIRCHNEIQA